jgi:hypothetical protein
MNIHANYRTFIAFVGLFGVPTQYAKTLDRIREIKTYWIS